MDADVIDLFLTCDDCGMFGSDVDPREDRQDAEFYDLCTECSVTRSYEIF